MIPMELRRYLPRGVVNVGFVSLPPTVFTYFASQINRPLHAFTCPDDQAMPSFLIDSDKLEENEPPAEAPAQGGSLQGSMSASWIRLSPESAAEVAEKKTALGYEGPENLLPYLSDALSKGEIEDTDRISFEHGTIQVESSEKSGQILHFLLERTYGPSLAVRVSMMESLFAVDAPPLTWGKVKKVLVGVAAQARVADFELLFKKIKGKPIDGFLCVESLKPEEREQISQVDEFEKLSPDHFQILERAFRTLPVNGQAKPTLAACFPASGGYNLGFWRSSHFIRNARIAQTLGYVNANALDSTDISLATAEYLGKTASYLSLEEGMVIPLPSNTNGRIYFKVERVFKNNGIVFQVLVPVTEKQQQEEEPEDALSQFPGVPKRSHLRKKGCLLWPGISTGEELGPTFRMKLSSKRSLHIWPKGRS